MTEAQEVGEPTGPPWKRKALQKYAVNSFFIVFHIALIDCSDSCFHKK